MTETIEKIARPATPSLDLLDGLFGEVYLPAAMTKLAAVGQTPTTVDELTSACAVGEQVANAIDARKTAGELVSPIEQHAAKVASMIEGAPSQTRVDAIINANIDGDAELSAKFAAALKPAAT